MESLYRLSALVRGYDLRLGYNRVILGLSALGALVAAAVRLVADATVEEALWRAVAAGAAVFAAAAIAKELDPDRPRAAVVAAAVAAAGAWFIRPDTLDVLAALLWLILAVRLINRSTGLRPKLSDALALLAVAAWLLWRGFPLFGALAGGVFLLDARLHDGRRLHAVLGALALVSIAIAWALGWVDLAPIPSGRWLTAGLLAVAVAFIPVILTYYTVAATADATGAPLNGARVQAGQAVALGSGLSLASWQGQPGAALLFALWAAFLGIVGYYLLITRARRSAASL
ncbi:hypothetical protein [Promineifilum sp.]|uniref:hypothetical protein n=1 Tax=Promineifilum sp. TaxID=2664178 RepID=UPI0035AEA8C2